MVPRSVFAAAAALLLVADASAQTVFPVVLSGGQAVPATATPHDGEGTLYLDPITRIVTYEISTSGVTGAFVSATLRRGEPGQVGPAVLPLAGTPDLLAGSVGPLDSADVTRLLEGDLHVLISTTSFPAGELRGQLTSSRDEMVAFGDGSQEVPPVPGNGYADVTLTVNGDHSISYDVAANNITGSAAAAHIRAGKPGQTGPILATLKQTGYSQFVGTTAPLSDLDLARIRAGHAYVAVETWNNPSGEVRGQIVASFTTYGTSCGGSPGTPALTGEGLPSPGGSISVSVTGGTSGGAGLLFVGLAGGQVPYGPACNLLVAPPLLTLPLPPLNSQGELDLPATLPSTQPALSWLVLQYFGEDSLAPAGFASSNGLQMHLSF